MILFVLIGFVLFVIIELIPLYKQEMWRDFWVSLALGVIASVLAGLMALHFPIPSPETPIRKFITAIIGKR